MPPSDSDIIYAAQSDGESNNNARKELVSRFGKLMWYFAGKSCQLFGLDQSEIEDIVQDATADLFDSTIARFDPSHQDASAQNYLRGIVQNAARRHTRFVRNGNGQHHDYADADNARKHLPVSVSEVYDTCDDLLTSIDCEHTNKMAAKVMLFATPEIMVLIHGLFHRGETPEQVATVIGVARTTIIRRMARFREHVLAKGVTPYHAA